jgi:hypothetical protein
MTGADCKEKAAPPVERDGQEADVRNQQSHNITSDQAFCSPEWLWALLFLVEFDTRAAEVLA